MQVSDFLNGKGRFDSAGDGDVATAVLDYGDIDDRVYEQMLRSKGGCDFIALRFRH